MWSIAIATKPATRQRLQLKDALRSGSRHSGPCEKSTTGNRCWSSRERSASSNRVRPDRVEGCRTAASGRPVNDAYAAVSSSAGVRRDARQWRPSRRAQSDTTLARRGRGSRRRSLQLVDRRCRCRIRSHEAASYLNDREHRRGSATPESRTTAAIGQAARATGGVNRPGAAASRMNRRPLRTAPRAGAYAGTMWNRAPSSRDVQGCDEPPQLAQNRISAATAVTASPPVARPTNPRRSPTE